MIVNIIFGLVIVLTVGGAIVTVTSQNLARAVFALLFTFLGVTGLYFLMQADFIAMVQLMVYIGGITILLLFGVMLTQKAHKLKVGFSAVNPNTGAIISMGVFVGLVMLILNVDEWYDLEFVNLNSTISKIGENLLGQWVLPFEVASILLLMALVGAATLARRREK
ncbi:MAG: NADH-quinone oxidoreductase subunit J [Candidatus Marinimicrobia bacterium]|nr:NADH-quinone oxidoreductase subunit J [Candidatus Neomarinimicrobiota bacterium]